MTDYKNQIEALLFASGRLMDVNILISLTGASDKEVIKNNIDKLKEEYIERNSPLMIVEEKDGWKITVKEQYLPLVRKIVSETELPKTILETLAIIAWKSPVLQSEVVEIRHNKAYEHITVLEELGFIKKEERGRSHLITLTEKFYEYFDVEGSKDIREIFSKMTGKRPKEGAQEALIKPKEQTEVQKEIKDVEPLTEENPKESEEFHEL